MITVLKTLYEDKMNDVTVRECEYRRADFVGPFKKFTERITRHHIYLTFERGWTVEDLKYARDDDTNINLAAKAAFDVIKNASGRKVCVSVFGRFYEVKGSMDEIRSKIESAVLRSAEL